MSSLSVAGIALAPARPPRLAARPDARRPRGADTCRCLSAASGDRSSSSTDGPQTSGISSRRSQLAAMLAAGAGSLLSQAGDAEAFVVEGGPAPEASQVSESTQVKAFVAALDGRDALGNALGIRGTVGGARLRLRNLLPRYKRDVETLTACLPILVSVLPAPETDVGWVTAADNVLIGCSQVVSMNQFAAKGEFEKFADDDIPFSDIDLALQSVDVFLAQAPQGILDKANKSRCKQRLNAARNYDEMQDIANSSVCAVGM